MRTLMFFSMSTDALKVFANNFEDGNTVKVAYNKGIDYLDGFIKRVVEKNNRPFWYKAIMMEYQFLCNEYFLSTYRKVLYVPVILKSGLIDKTIKTIETGEEKND